MKTFQIILLVVFGLLAAGGVIYFTKGDSSGGGQSKTADVRVVMWGTIPRGQVATAIEYFNTQKNGIVVSYVYKNPATYEREILDAFAFGGTPDIFLLPNHLINTYRDKIVTIPYQSYPERIFTDTYIRSADILKTDQGILGFPVFADPLVMFYNRDHLDSKSITRPPVYWKDLNEIVPILTDKSEILEIRRGGVALGEASNILNFKEILVALNLQLGNSITAWSPRFRRYDSVFSSGSTISSRPAEETLRFFMEFSNPLKTVYSWNKSMPQDRVAFAGGDLSIYFGFASEISTIQRMNPNLNFDIANIPQVEGTNSVTYSRLYSLAIPRNTRVFNQAFSIISQFANGPFAYPLAVVSEMAPVRRDILASPRSLDRFRDLYFKSAIQSRSWVDPNPSFSDELFEQMIESVLSGLRTVPGAITATNQEMTRFLSR